MTDVDDGEVVVRRKRGEGSRRVFISGGGGPWSTLAGDAGHFDLVPSLTSLPRLRIMYVLCVNGWMRSQALSNTLKMGYKGVYKTLSGLRSGLMVQCRNADIPRPCALPGSNGMRLLEWNVTDVGRIFFWRFGRCTATLMSWTADEADALREMEGDPLEWLTSFAQPTLLRPLGLAMASRILWDKNRTERELAHAMRVNPATVQMRMKVWNQMGWLEPTRRYYPEARYHPSVYHAPTWKFSRPGLDAIERHVYAVWRLVQHSGYDGKGEVWYPDTLDEPADDPR